ncbi:hypothetical protein ACH5RR_026728 [Cinchona calisaya]|uniref:Uncharacterized protein n=1 Tax=Cinchona calisaya TaxID=153742 RepID=A0ABD2Z3F5_9GENT
MRNMQKEIKSLLELTCPTPTNVHNVAVASNLASSQANHPPNIKAVEMQNKVPHICSLLYFRKSIIDMDYAGGEDPDELVESGALSPRSRNYLSEQVFRNLLSVSSASAAVSVKKILEEQRDLSNDQLKVIVVGSQCDLS